MHTITSPTGTTVQPQGARSEKGFRFWIGGALLVGLALVGASYVAIEAIVGTRSDREY